MEACGALAESILGEDDLNYIEHWSCLRKASARARKAREREESDALVERKA